MYSGLVSVVQRYRLSFCSSTVVNVLAFVLVDEPVLVIIDMHVLVRAQVLGYILFKHLFASLRLSSNVFSL